VQEIPTEFLAGSPRPNLAKCLQEFPRIILQVLPAQTLPGVARFSAVFLAGTPSPNLASRCKIFSGFSCRRSRLESCQALQDFRLIILQYSRQKPCQALQDFRRIILQYSRQKPCQALQDFRRFFLQVLPAKTLLGVARFSAVFLAENRPQNVARVIALIDRSELQEFQRNFLHA
jgi:hypothetical protein